jgi:hypothetical protein
LLALERAAVLQAFDVQVATDVGNHVLALDHTALERGVAATDDRHVLAAVDVGIRVGHVLAVCIAARFAHRQVDRETVGGAANAEAHTNAAAARLVRAVLACHAFRRHQVDLVVGRQGDAVAAGDLAADGAQVAGLALARADDRHVAAGLDRRAHGGAAGRVGHAFAFRVAQADADATILCRHCELAVRTAMSTPMPLLE